MGRRGPPSRSERAALRRRWTQNYIEEVERGRRVPSPEVIQRLAAALGLPKARLEAAAKRARAG